MVRRLPCACAWSAQGLHGVFHQAGTSWGACGSTGQQVAGAAGAARPGRDDPQSHAPADRPASIPAGGRHGPAIGLLGRCLCIVFGFRVLAGEPGEPGEPPVTAQPPAVPPSFCMGEPGEPAQLVTWQSVAVRRPCVSPPAVAGGTGAGTGRRPSPSWRACRRRLVRQSSRRYPIRPAQRPARSRVQHGAAPRQ